MSDYANIANLSWENIPEPQVLPVGTYLLKLTNAVFQPSKEADKSPVVLFVYKPKEAMEDVKADELAALGDDYDISENKVFARFYIEDGSSWDSVRKHIEKHGVEPKGDIKASLKALKGSEILGYLDVNNFTKQDGTQGRGNNVKEFAAVNA